MDAQKMMFKNNSEKTVKAEIIAGNSSRRAAAENGRSHVQNGSFITIKFIEDIDDKIDNFQLILTVEDFPVLNSSEALKVVLGKNRFLNGYSLKRKYREAHHVEIEKKTDKYEVIIHYKLKERGPVEGSTIDDPMEVDVDPRIIHPDKP